MTHTVLIADDEPNIVVSLEYLMKREGHEVLVARDGDEALALARSAGPALVLLDVMMPGKSGFEVCQALRADAATAGITRAAPAPWPPAPGSRTAWSCRRRRRRPDPARRRCRAPWR